MSVDYLKKVLNARVYEVAHETRLQSAKKLSKRLSNQILLKREDEQDIFSFKIRGAYNKLANLSEELLKKGVIAASAGNHAQGVAYAALKLECKAIIVMPTTTPEIKIDAVKALGAEVRLVGDNFDDASHYAQNLVNELGMTYVPPFDDPDVIAGQGSVGFEIIKQHPRPIDAIFVAVGGGGLIAGIAAYIKQVRPEIKIIGVEPDNSDAMMQSVNAGERVKLNRVGQFADGVAVKLVGEETFRLAQEYVDEFMTVDTDEICAAVKDIFEETRTIVEPAGAISVAGIKKYVQATKVSGQTLIGINCGANVNFDRLRHISERAEIGEQREGIFAATIPERPGSFKEFCSTLSVRQITEFNYRYADSGKAHVYVGIQVKNHQETNAVLESLSDQNYQVLDLTNNEMAKLHVRHMVGGHAPGVKNEQVFRFIFPEKPGALLNFLTQMGENWNISMFHYRNHGADFGRVLIGIQIPPEENNDFLEFLDEIGYDYENETDNPAYKLFLG